MAQKRKSYSIKEKNDAVNAVLELLPRMSCSKACSEVGVPQTNFVRWMELPQKLTKNMPSFKERYESGSTEFIEKMADTIYTLAMAPADTVDGRVDSGFVSNKRLQIDTLKWTLSKLCPQRYGDKLEVTGDANLGTTTNITIINDIKNMNDNEVEDIKSNVSAMLEPSKKRY